MVTAYAENAEKEVPGSPLQEWSWPDHDSQGGLHCRVISGLGEVEGAGESHSRESKCGYKNHTDVLGVL